MPVRVSAWAIYDVFETANPGEQVFVGVVSDAQWKGFCAAFALDDLASDEAMATNNQRVAARAEIIPRVKALFAAMTRGDLLAKLELIGLPFAPIARPEDLFEDAHLKQSGGLLSVTIPGGAEAMLPALPLAFEGERLGLRHDIPGPGEDTRAILQRFGVSAHEIETLLDRAVVS
jgi:crotonobetainyl-CoA:carnitine CoA-transferase CaiB-like acyl-CoA transferase